MLNITAKYHTSQEELRSAKSLVKDILGVLKSVTPDSNLTQDVGIFVRQMPDYKILVKDAEKGKEILRNICSGEITPVQAIVSFEKALSELDMLCNNKFLNKGYEPCLCITQSTLRLIDEVDSAKSLIKNIQGVLMSVRPDSNLTQDVGIFVCQMPDYKVLSRDAENAKHLLRKVCTGEISPEDAARKFSDARQELIKLEDMLFS